MEKVSYIVDGEKLARLRSLSPCGRVHDLSEGWFEHWDCIGHVRGALIALAVS
jgi:hypothetical protein